MRCVSHVQRNAECYCKICGQPICGECRDYLGACIYCAERETKDFKKEWIIPIALFVCSFLIFTVISIMEMPLGAKIADELLSAAICSFVIASIPFGWKGLNKLTPNIFLFLPLAGWAIYFFLKLLLCVYFGWIFVIIKIFTSYKYYKINKKIVNNVKRIKYEIKNGNL